MNTKLKVNNRVISGFKLKTKIKTGSTAGIYISVYANDMSELG